MGTLNRPFDHRHEIRWAIWGTGTVAGSVARAIALTEGCRVAAVGSRRIERAQQFARDHQISEVTSSLSALVASDDVDIVYIATPNHRHLADCLTVISGRKAVLCEKPFAMTSAEATQIATAAREASVFCMEAMWSRFLPAVREAKRLVDAGELGHLEFASGDFALREHLDPTMPSRLFASESGGGALLDRGVYLVSLLSYLFGRPTAVSALARIGRSDVDEDIAFALEFSGGGIAACWASLRSDGANALTLRGSERTIEICAPFFSSDALRVRRPKATAPHASDASGSGIRAAAARRARASARLRHLNRVARGVATVLGHGSQIKLAPVIGDAYSYQIQEAAACIRAGRTESDVMPLADSIDVLSTLDALRATWAGSDSGPGHLTRTPTRLA